MRYIRIAFKGDEWDNESEAERIEEEVQKALDEAGVDYVDLSVE